MERRQLGVWMLVIGFVAIGLVMVKLFSAAETGQAAGAPGAIGTSGFEAGTAGGAHPADTSDPNARVLESIARDADNPQLIGRPVTLHVDGQELGEQLAAFWVGDGGSRMLVVLNRDTRSSEQRQRGDAPSHGIAPAQPGQPVTITGTVQRLPRAEEMASWRLTAADRAALQDQKVYIQAHTVTPGGLGT